MKIITRAAIFLVVMTAIIVVLNRVVPNPYTGQREQVMSVLNHPNEWQSLTFGRSHAYSLDYKYYDKKGVNLALGGRDLASIEYLLDQFLPVCDSLEEVILFISYTSLYFDNTAMSSGNLNDARKALYYSVPSMRPINIGDINNFIFGKFFTFIQADHGWKMIKDAMSGHIEQPKVFAEEGSYLTEEEMELSGEKQSARDKLDKSSALRYNPNVVRDNDNCLRRIISKCQSKKVKVIMVQAPYYHSYTERVPKKIINEVDSVIFSVANDCSIDYFDFSTDQRFSHNITLFSNSDHLNEEGEREFTILFKEEVTNK